MDDYGCPACGSAAVAYPRALEDDEPVMCSGCGAFVSLYGEFKKRTERVVQSESPRLPVSGC
jgi:hypothetical protein